MPDLTKILSATRALTLSGVPTGFQPSLLADLARAASGRAVFIAADDAAMRSIASTAPFFTPDLEVVSFPAWDCLPYDRASPTLRVMAERDRRAPQAAAEGDAPATLPDHRERRDAARADAVPDPPAGRDAQAR